MERSASTGRLTSVVALSVLTSVATAELLSGTTSVATGDVAAADSSAAASDDGLSFGGTDGLGLGVFVSVADKEEDCLASARPEDGLGIVAAMFWLPGADTSAVLGCAGG